MGMQVRGFLLLLYLLASVASYAQPSQIFWADQSYKKIQSAYLDGSHVTDIITNVEIVEGIAIDTTVNPMKIYYCESGKDRIMRMNFDGSDTAEVVTGITGLEDLDIDPYSRKIFWLKNTYNDDRVMSADMDSLNSNVKDIYTSGYAMYDYRGIALDMINRMVYWSQSVYSNYDRISRISYDGGGKETVVSINYIRDIDMIGNMIYWIRSNGEMLIRSDMEVSYLDTILTNVRSFFFTMDTSLGMAFWTGKAYSAQANCIMRGKLDNSDTREIVTDLGNNLSGIALYYNPDFNTAVETKPEVVHDFKLYQNYPNPFNPKTAISYELKASSYVDLSIYNIIGQKVATLVSEEKLAGQYQVEWDASLFASGVYLYRLSADQGFVQTKKLVLLK